MALPLAGVAGIAGAVSAIKGLFGGGEKPASRTLAPQTWSAVGQTKRARTDLEATNKKLMIGGGVILAAGLVFLLARGFK